MIWTVVERRNMQGGSFCRGLKLSSYQLNIDHGLGRWSRGKSSWPPSMMDGVQSQELIR